MLNSKQFDKFSKLIKDRLGIHIGEAKRELVQSKISKLMRTNEILDYDEYYDLIINNKTQHWNTFVDEITIHKTNFFREDNHFNFIRDKVETILAHNPRILRNYELRAWSSACSTGDEAYTLAMVLKEYLPVGINPKILATDVSPKVIKEAHQAEYVLDNEDLINAYFLGKYFVRNSFNYKIANDIKNLVTFRTFNLMNIFPFQDKFDIIFCRNVMIYFDTPTQEQLIKKFYDVLVPGGLLFIGHSESLTQKQYKFKYIQPTIYMKTE
jgi:chemotaxis protein methyltransferase CheR